MFRSAPPLLAAVTLIFLLFGCGSLSQKATSLSVTHTCTFQAKGMAQDKADVISRDWELDAEKCNAKMLSVDKDEDSDTETKDN